MEITVKAGIRRLPETSDAEKSEATPTATTSFDLILQQPTVSFVN